jgi:hypothetical protein
LPSDTTIVRERDSIVFALRAGPLAALPVEVGLVKWKRAEEQ